MGGSKDDEDGLDGGSWGGGASSPGFGRSTGRPESSGSGSMADGSFSVTGPLSGNNSGGNCAGTSGNTGASLPGGKVSPGSSNGWKTSAGGRGPSSPGNGGSTAPPGRQMAPPSIKNSRLLNFTWASYLKNSSNASLEMPSCPPGP